ncbi:MAG: SH3 domain-containing protein [Leptolyngbyaceae cyanobacterium bins.349]|nr:SH3 domain-containing protein [Leptolyngbyaceae cyanobacterium bins.349]
MNTNRVIGSAVAATVAVLAIALPTFARPATLIAQESGSRINVRSAPTTKAASPHYGLAGDRVEVMSSLVGRDDYSWNYVKFSSGATGWVRGDFIRYNQGSQKYALLLGKDGRSPSETSRQRINVRSAPSTNAASPHFGLEGDIVQVLTQTTGKDGKIWRYVKFPAGAEGWIRGDLVQVMEEGGC